MLTVTSIGCGASSVGTGVRASARRMNGKYDFSEFPGSTAMSQNHKSRAGSNCTSCALMSTTSFVSASTSPTPALSTVVPFEAASTALIVVGFLMMTAVRTIDWNDYEIAIPAFLTIVLMPFTYSISNGIGAGLITYALLKLVRGKGREVHPLLYAVAALFVVYFLRGPLESILF